MCQVKVGGTFEVPMGLHVSPAPSLPVGQQFREEYVCMANC
jgi:hypothetical protein